MITATIFTFMGLSFLVWRTAFAKGEARSTRIAGGIAIAWFMILAQLLWAYHL